MKLQTAHSDESDVVLSGEVGRHESADRPGLAQTRGRRHPGVLSAVDADKRVGARWLDEAVTALGRVTNNELAVGLGFTGDYAEKYARGMRRHDDAGPDQGLYVGTLKRLADAGHRGLVKEILRRIEQEIDDDAPESRMVLPHQALVAGARVGVMQETVVRAVADNVVTGEELDEIEEAAVSARTGCDQVVVTCRVERARKAGT